MKVAKKLPDDEWQFADVGRKKGIYAKAGKDEDGKTEWRTRLVDDACIFLNRPGFDGRPGLRAAHATAMRTGQHHSDVKPEVCWQLPLRRIDEEQDDGSVVSTLTEFGRDGWGEGGDDFAGGAPRPPRRSSGAEPVYREPRASSCARCSATSSTARSRRTSTTRRGRSPRRWCTRRRSR